MAPVFRAVWTLTLLCGKFSNDRAHMNSDKPPQKSETRTAIGSMMSKEPTLKKSDPEQLVELLDALRLCASLARHAKDDPVFFGPLATQIRSLLTDPNKNSKALLIRMCEQFSNVPQVYSLPSIQVPVADQEFFHSASLVAEAIELSVERTSASQTPIQIAQLPRIEVAMFEGNTVTIGDLISWKANKYGGAH